MNARLLFPILAIVMGLSACSKKTVRQISSSMEPTIKKGEFVTMDQGAYRSNLPARWEVVTFEPPQHPDQLWTFRIVGLPGETIDITPTGVSIDGKIISRPSSIAGIGLTSAPPEIRQAFPSWLSLIRFPPIPILSSVTMFRTHWTAAIGGH